MIGHVTPTPTSMRSVDAAIAPSTDHTNGLWPCARDPRVVVVGDRDEVEARAPRRAARWRPASAGRAPRSTACSRTTSWCLLLLLKKGSVLPIPRTESTLSKRRNAACLRRAVSPPPPFAFPTSRPRGQRLRAHGATASNHAGSLASARRERPFQAGPDAALAVELERGRGRTRRATTRAGCCRGPLSGPGRTPRVGGWGASCRAGRRGRRPRAGRAPPARSPSTTTRGRRALHRD